MDRRATQLSIMAFVMFVIALVPAVPQDQNQQLPEVEESQPDVFAPFVSRLRVAVRDPQVRLTWRDAEDLTDGKYEVYRATEQLDSESIPDATLVATVEQGVESFLDTPSEAGEYYYAVLARDADGNRIDAFIPLRNITIRPVPIQNVGEEENPAAQIYDLAAEVFEDSVVLRFDPSRTDRELVIYRSTGPFSELESISDATLLDRFPSTNRRYVDYPVPGVPYYYGVFDAQNIENGEEVIEPDENVLSSPVELQVFAAQELDINIPPATKRPAPLPILQLGSALQTAPYEAMLPHGGVAQPVSPATERAIASLLERAPERERYRPEPVILPEERSAPESGVSRTLAQVVIGPFNDGDYARAEELFGNILELPLSDEWDKRVRYYRGQALYFIGKREEAFFDFLIASDGPLYMEAKEWIDGILTLGIQDEATS